MDKLKKLYLLSLILIYSHAIEEIATGFAYGDHFMAFFADIFNTSPQSFYWVSHIIWWLALPILYLLLHKSKYALYLLTIYGLVFFIEIHHVIKGITSASYHPGMITAIIYPIFGVFYWKQLLNVWKTK